MRSSSVLASRALGNSLLRLERPGAVAVVCVGQPVDVTVGVQRVEAVLVPALGQAGQRPVPGAALRSARATAYAQRGYGYRELRPAREPLTRGVRMDRKKLFLQAQRREE